MKETGQDTPLAGGSKGAYSKNNRAMEIRAVSDIVFKFIFGTQESEELLKAFVNAVLRDGGYPPVQELRVVNPFNAKTYLDDKVSVIDTRAMDKRGNIYNLEVQIRSQADFQERSLYYWANAYSGQLPEGHEYRMLHKVVSISILDFMLFPGHLPFHSCFMLRENNYPELVLSQDCVMHYLECPKLEAEPVSEVEQWLYLLLHAGKEDKRMDVLIDQNEYFRKAMDRYKYFVSDEQARLALVGASGSCSGKHPAYESRQKFLHDQASNIAEARDLGIEAGLAQGREEGKIEGKKEEKQEIARNLLASGLTAVQIAQATGLSTEEIEALDGRF